MPPQRRDILAMLASAPLAAPGAALAQAVPGAQDIADAYIYLLARALVIRQERSDLREPSAIYNAIKYNPLGSAEFVNPNFDVAYLEAWIAVDEQTPALLEVPEIQGRYYTAQILDEWGEVIANINERTFPSKPFGTFALVAPGSTAPIPAGAGRIELHSRKAKLLGRVELKGDPDGAVRLQRAFRLSSAGSPAIAPPPDLPDFDNRGLIGAAIFEQIDTRLASALDVSPVAAAMQQKVRWVAAQVAKGATERAAVETELRRVIPEFQDFAVTRSAPRRNHWTGGASAGNYDGNYRLRSATNFAGIWANVGDEVLYFVATRDADEQPLDGSASYVMHFPADRLPDNVVNAYWSVILVTVPEYRIAPNPLGRFNFNNHSALTHEADGSLKIAIGPRVVAGVPESNWLPSPDGKPFSLTFRTYVPKEAVRRGEWQPAPVTRI